MNQALPTVSFESRIELDIEVKSLEETYQELVQIEDHDPFTPHKIQFYCIIVVAEGSYSHYVDFDFYILKRGSALFISKNQVHHFTEELQQVKGVCMVINSQFVENKYFQSEKFRLNRLFNYYVESPVIHQEDIGEDTFVRIARRIYYEFHYPNNVAKSEMLRAMIHILLLKSERIKSEQSV
ncbi:MAG: AraC family ligand binding domain-containing protein, partial [Bacteroidota bacterium]